MSDVQRDRGESSSGDPWRPGTCGRSSSTVEVERLKGLVIALMNDADPTRAEKAEAEIERLREVHAQVVEGLRQAREGWAKERAEVERLRAALRRLLDYTEQIEQLAYDMGEQIEIHPIVAEARAALRGEGEK